MEWQKLNIIDCPGSDDFVGAAITALNVTDTAILLLNGQYGPEVGTQNHFRYTEKLGKPVIFLVNQLDSEKCDFDHVLEQLKENYGSKVVPVQYPLATGPDFNSLIDVLLMKNIHGVLTVEHRLSKKFLLRKWKKLRLGIRLW